MNTSVLAVAVLAMLAVGGVFYALFYPMLSGEKRAEKRRKEFATPVAARGMDRETQARMKRGQIAQSLKEIENRENARHKVTLENRISQAGLSWSRQKYYVISAATAVVLGLLLLIAGGSPYLGAVGLFIGGFGLPVWFLKRCKTRRLKKFGIEFPNALDVIVRGIKAGLPVNDCLRIIASEAAEPVRGEFRQIIEAQALGLPLPEAAVKLFERMPCAEANFFGIVIAIQQKTGGNLSETLGNLSRVLRERRKMRDKIQAVSMEAKASAAIIGSLPPVVAALVYLTTPKYIELLWLTQVGQFALVASGIWMLIGVLVMRKMINFDI
ncbi:type II secretion system F family protein [Bosea sp. SSUT16]|jgi:tight adherence protein B|uniref:Type II secretion system F family protein n=1 Tax=Bosea spartocytisi TaxID=2773451 RepID=A0A927EAU5_9HYPH|nr:type II secretion system F family protein [Bosea spartocytisi]MBD3845374.1 type II secretion system F family protein [Bosea spartocytisi]MCT4472544.1 type II secretion system F family protein [Bosea spartocytisi]